MCNHRPSLGFPSPHTHFCFSGTIFIPHTLTLEHSPSLSRTHTHQLSHRVRIISQTSTHTNSKLKTPHTHTCHLLLEGGIFGLQAEQLCIDRWGGGARGCRGRSLPLLQTLVLLLQLFDLGTQLEPRGTHRPLLCHQTSTHWNSFRNVTYSPDGRIFLQNESTYTPWTAPASGCCSAV